MTGSTEYTSMNDFDASLISLISATPHMQCHSGDEGKMAESLFMSRRNAWSRTSGLASIKIKVGRFGEAVESVNNKLVLFECKMARKEKKEKKRKEKKKKRRTN